MTIIDINELAPAWVADLRADGASDAQVLEYANAPPLASHIDEVPSLFREGFRDGEPDSEILDWWNYDPEPWLKIDLDREAPERWLDWKRNVQGLSERVIQEEFHEAGGNVPEVILDLFETTFVDGLTFSHHLCAYSGDSLIVGANLTDDGRFIWADEDEPLSSPERALLEVLNWLRINAPGRWRLEGDSQDDGRGAVWLSFIDGCDYLKASEMLAPGPEVDEA